MTRHFLNSLCALALALPILIISSIDTAAFSASLDSVPLHALHQTETSTEETEESTEGETKEEEEEPDC